MIDETKLKLETLNLQPGEILIARIPQELVKSKTDIEGWYLLLDEIRAEANCPIVMLPPEVELTALSDAELERIGLVRQR